MRTNVQTGTADLIASSEALRILGLKSRTSLSVMVARGQLTPYTSTPLGFLFLRSDVEAFAASRAAVAS